MTPAENEALKLHETICAAARDYPRSGGSVGQLLQALTDWRSNNSGFEALKRAEPNVQLCFLDHSLDWLTAEAKLNGNLQVCPAVSEAIQLALERVPKPLPAELVCRLVRGYRQAWASLVQLYFPIRPLLSLLTREQVTDELRAELQKLYVLLAPSPSGKIHESTKELRDRVAELMWKEGEGPIEAGRGPWSHIVFNEVAAKDEITRAGWHALLEHCRALEQAAPGAKWRKRARELMVAIGETDVLSTLLRWFRLGPTPGQPPGARPPIEDSAYQKGAVWCLSLTDQREAAIAIGDFGAACLRKVPMLGAVSQKIGFACVQALGTMETREPVAQLTRLRSQVKYSVARRLIEKCLQQTAERSGVSVGELEDISVGHYGLNPEGVAEIVIADSRAVVRLSEDGQVALTWHNSDGKLLKSPPASLRREFAKEVRSVARLKTELEQAYAAQRARLELLFTSPRSMSLAHWREFFIDHPLLGFLGRRVIWVFSDGQESAQSGMWSGTGVKDSSGSAVSLDKTTKVTLWHPAVSGKAAVQQWRQRVFATGIRQPFRQAFREFYEVTDEDQQTRTYSNRFAGILMRQHQLASLCRARGWEYRLMSTDFDGGNVPTRRLPQWNMHVEFYVDLPPDRDHSLRQSGLNEQTGAGINLFVGSDQVRFYRDSKEVAMAEVPVVVYSEIMRDVDLFTSVCAVGEDETWTDQGDRGMGIRGDRLDPKEISAVIALRADMLARVLPRTQIAHRCRVRETFLEVRGQLGTYRIHLGWGETELITDSGIRRLRIPQEILDAVSLNLSDLPLDLDHRTEMILRKAHVLAQDWKIDSPELVRQFAPE